LRGFVFGLYDVVALDLLFDLDRHGGVFFLSAWRWAARPGVGWCWWRCAAFLRSVLRTTYLDWIPAFAGMTK
jgi:hypothetical protein